MTDTIRIDAAANELREQKESLRYLLNQIAPKCDDDYCLFASKYLSYGDFKSSEQCLNNFELILNAHEHDLSEQKRSTTKVANGDGTAPHANGAAANGHISDATSPLTQPAALAVAIHQPVGFRPLACSVVSGCNIDDQLTLIHKKRIALCRNRQFLAARAGWPRPPTPPGLIRKGPAPALPVSEVQQRVAEEHRRAQQQISNDAKAAVDGAREAAEDEQRRLREEKEEEQNRKHIKTIESTKEFLSETEPTNLTAEAPLPAGRTTATPDPAPSPASSVTAVQSPFASPVLVCSSEPSISESKPTEPVASATSTTPTSESSAASEMTDDDAKTAGSSETKEPEVEPEKALDPKAEHNHEPSDTAPTPSGFTLQETVSNFEKLRTPPINCQQVQTRRRRTIQTSDPETGKRVIVETTMTDEEWMDFVSNSEDRFALPPEERTENPCDTPTSVYSNLSEDTSERTPAAPSKESEVDQPADDDADLAEHTSGTPPGPQSLSTRQSVRGAVQPPGFERMETRRNKRKRESDNLESDGSGDTNAEAEVELAEEEFADEADAAASLAVEIDADASTISATDHELEEEASESTADPNVLQNNDEKPFTTATTSTTRRTRREIVMERTRWTRKTRRLEREKVDEPSILVGGGGSNPTAAATIDSCADNETASFAVAPETNDSQFAESAADAELQSVDDGDL